LLDHWQRVGFGHRYFADGKEERLSSVAPAGGEKAIAPRSSKGARTRAKILDAAKQIFEEDGFLEARISDIAERAGLSHGSFYHYFDSKEQIFREVAGAVFDKITDPLINVVLAPSSAIPPDQRLHQALRQYFESYRAEARMMGVIEQVARYDEHLGALDISRHREVAAQVAESIRQLQRRGMADPKLDPDLAAAGIGALAGRFAERWLVQGVIECTLEEAAEQVTRMVVNLMQLKLGSGLRGRRTSE
jgi:AcrR family transcriptional regulator